MRNGWTGGQYSLVRTLLGAYLCGQYLSALPYCPPLIIAGVIAALLFAVGVYDRFAAVANLGILVFLFRDGPLGANAALPFVAWLLLVHMATPPAPFGSIPARHRIDPAGDWRMPRSLFAATWLGFACGYAYFGLAGWQSSATGMIVAHLFTLDPGWIRGSRPGVETMFFDGHCGLCHASVRFALAEAPEDDTLLFAPLFGETYEAKIPVGSDLPDSIAILTSDDRVLVRSVAARHVACRLGGFWRVLALGIGVLPRAVADWFYDRVAKVRHRLFRRPAESCPLLPPSLQSRILP
jgi:predicted DCC family thiol-disulfide oxidoreductase YuxK